MESLGRHRAGTTAKQVCLPEFGQIIVLEPNLKFRAVETTKGRGAADSLDHDEVFRLEIDEEGGGLRGDDTLPRV